MPVYLHYTSTEEARRLLQGSLIVLPAGSVEQHCNAPLGLDALIAEAVAARACLLLEERGITCIILPTLYYGFSHEWLDSPGTVSLRPETIISIILDVVGSLAAHGAGKIAILNGHGGNSGTLEAAARVAARKYNVTVGVIDYWRAAGLRIGHCDKIEEELAGTLLGLTNRCSCRGRVELKRYRVAMPSYPPSVGAEGSEPIGVSKLLEAVADALEDFYRGGSGEPRL